MHSKHTYTASTFWFDGFVQLLHKTWKNRIWRSFSTLLSCVQSKAFQYDTSWKRGLLIGLRIKLLWLVRRVFYNNTKSLGTYYEKANSSSKNLLQSVTSIFKKNLSLCFTAIYSCRSFSDNRFYGCAINDCPCNVSQLRWQLSAICNHYQS